MCQSFAIVVLFLKVLLNQQGLDKPFTGGLGSFKLYVLVASHVRTLEVHNWEAIFYRILIFSCYRSNAIWNLVGRIVRARSYLHSSFVMETSLVTTEWKI